MRIRWFVPLVCSLVVAGLMLACGTDGKAFAQGSGPPPGGPVPNSAPSVWQQVPRAAAITPTPPSIPLLSQQVPPSQPLIRASSGPMVVLYDQYDLIGSAGTTSQQFEAAKSDLTDYLADDFVVPPGRFWTVTQVEVAGTYSASGGPASAVNVFIGADANSLPGSVLVSRTGIVPSPGPNPGDFVIPLPAVVLIPGRYWISVQAVQDSSVAGQWYWIDRTATSNSAAAWENPGGGFGVCPSWGKRGATCGIDPSEPDQVFRLSGTVQLYGVLYDQYDHVGSSGTTSQQFEAAYSAYTGYAADDFVVPPGGPWTVTQVEVAGSYSASGGPASAVNVFVGADVNSLPGSVLVSRTGVIPFLGPNPGDFVIPLMPFRLSPGTYWISVQAVQNFIPAGQWYWTNRTVTSNNAAAWENPGGGFGVCPSWGRRGATCGISPSEPDQVFRLLGLRPVFLPLILR
jgi:hypothetical protein